MSWETIEDWEQKSGKPYPADGIVFELLAHPVTDDDLWVRTERRYTTGARSLRVIDDGKGPPPQGWRPLNRMKLPA